MPVPVAPVEVTPSTVGWPVIVGLPMLGLEANTKLPVPVAPVLVTPSNVTCPVTFNVLLAKIGPAIPTPPATTNEPLLYAVLVKVLLMFTFPVPFGVKVITPLVLVARIVLPDIWMLPNAEVVVCKLFTYTFAQVLPLVPKLY